MFQKSSNPKKIKKVTGPFFYFRTNLGLIPVDLFLNLIYISKMTKLVFLNYATGPTIA